MSEYRLVKNNGNELSNVDNKKEVVKVSEDTKLVPEKNPIVKVANGSIQIVKQAGKWLIKVTGHALTVVGNKLAQIDWGKVILTIIKAIFVKEENTYPTYHTTEHKVYRSSSMRQTYTSSESSNQAQIQNNKTESIETKKTKQISGKELKGIKNSKNPKQLEKKQNRNILKPQQNHLMIEKQKNNEKDK